MARHFLGHDKLLAQSTQRCRARPPRRKLREPRLGRKGPKSHFRRIPSNNQTLQRQSTTAEVIAGSQPGTFLLHPPVLPQQQARLMLVTVMTTRLDLGHHRTGQDKTVNRLGSHSIHWTCWPRSRQLWALHHAENRRSTVSVQHAAFSTQQECAVRCTLQICHASPRGLMTLPSMRQSCTGQVAFINRHFRRGPTGRDTASSLTIKLGQSPNTNGLRAATVTSAQRRVHDGRYWLPLFGRSCESY